VATRDDKEQMTLATAFPEPPPNNGIKAPPRAEQLTEPSNDSWWEASSLAARTGAHQERTAWERR